jgi:aspartate aminotransferase
MKTAAGSIALSMRVQQLAPSATLAVSARVRSLKEEGADIIDFGLGEPDFDTPARIKESAIESLRAGDTHYAPVPGSLAARQAIAEKLRSENSVECTADDIVITAGAKHAVYLALQALVDAGGRQEVILPTPAWVSYRPMIELCGGEVVEVEGKAENDLKITPAQLAGAMTPRTKAFIINSPSNPCGTMYSRAEFEALADVLVEYPHVAIITDEIYEKLIYTDEAHFSLGSIPELAERVITINGLSKAYAMTGWRLGYLCGPSGIAKAVCRLQGQMTSHVTSFCFTAIVEALNNGAAQVEAMRRVFAERAAIMETRLRAIPKLSVPRLTGAFYAFPDVSRYFGTRSPGNRMIDSATVFAAALLEEAHVAVVPGDDFGACAKGRVRLSFACATDVMREGLDRLATWLSQLKD